jgi:hypothetical protein
VIAVHLENMGAVQQLLAAMGDDFARQLITSLAWAARDSWIQLAGQKLHATRTDYINGIQQPEISGGVAVVALVGTLPNLVENGMPAFDMHATLLGPNVPEVPRGERGKHRSKAGHLYRSIPFRHANPLATTYQAGMPMGASYAQHPMVQNARALGKRVYAKAKQLTATTSQPHGGTQWGSRLRAGMAPKLRATQDSVIIQGVKRTRDAHSTDIYAGMVRKQKTYAKATQSSYVTFRTISEAMPDKWLSRGIEARVLSDQVSARVGELATQIVEKYAEGLK